MEKTGGMGTLAPRVASGVSFIARAGLAGAGAPHGHGGAAVRGASLPAWKGEGSEDAARWGHPRKESYRFAAGPSTREE